MTQPIYRHTRVFNDPDNMHLYPAISWKFVPLTSDSDMYVAHTAICNPEHDTFSKKEARRILNSPATTFTFHCKRGEDLVERAIEHIKGTNAPIAHTLVKRYNQINQHMIDIVVDEMTAEIREQYQGMNVRNLWNN